MLGCSRFGGHIQGAERLGTRPVGEMQKDLDAYLETYNTTTPTGPTADGGMKGRTPCEVFKAGISRKRTRKPSARKEIKNAT